MRNLTAKHAYKFNRAATHTDRKKEAKLTGDYGETDQLHDPYLHLKHRLAEQHGCAVSDITIDFHPVVGEDCIYISGIWFGYVDSDTELG